MTFYCKKCDQHFVVGWMSELIALGFFIVGILSGLWLLSIELSLLSITGAVGSFIAFVIFSKLFHSAVEEYCSKCMYENNLAVVQRIKSEDHIVGQILFNIKGSSKLPITEIDIENAKDVKTNINTLIHLGKYPEAIKQLEKYGLIEEAGQIRKNSYVVKTINLDVNMLIDQINEYGSVNSLICNNCGAPIDQKDIIEGKKFCSYCGGAFDLLTVNEVLRQMLAIDLNSSRQE